MTLRDFFLDRRRPARTPAADARNFRPQVETLEQRDCPSVAAPTGLQLTPLSASKVELTWNSNKNESGYIILRWDGTQSTSVATLSNTATSFIDTGLASLHQYYFTVEAFDKTSTAQAPWASVITLRDSITAPTNLKAVGVTNTQLTLTWTPSAGATSYTVYQWLGSSWNQGTAVPGSVPRTSVGSFTVHNLSPGQTYYFQVKASNATNSAMSAVVSGTTTAPLLMGPANVTVKALNSSSAQLTWGLANGALGYNIYRATGSSGQYVLIQGTAGSATTVSASTTSFIDKTLQSGQQYWYYVQAVRFNTTANSQSFGVTTPGGLVLVKPANFTATAINSGGALLSWDPSAGAAGYHVYYWLGSSWELLTTVPQGTQPGPLQVQVNGLNLDQTHWFMVQAFTASGQFANSDMKFVNL